MRSRAVPVMTKMTKLGSVIFVMTTRTNTVRYLVILVIQFPIGLQLLYIYTDVDRDPLPKRSTSTNGYRTLFPSSSLHPCFG